MMSKRGEMMIGMKGDFSTMMVVEKRMMIGGEGMMMIDEVKMQHRVNLPHFPRIKFWKFEAHERIPFSYR